MITSKLENLSARHLWRVASHIGMKGDPARLLSPKSVGVERVVEYCARLGITVEGIDAAIAATAEASKAPPAASVQGAVGDALAALQAALANQSAHGAGMSEDAVTALVVELLDARNARPIVVETPRATVTMTERLHLKFDTVLKILTTRDPSGHRLNAWVWGPAASGKSTLGKQIAKALDLPFHATSAIQSKYDLLGFVSPSLDRSSLETPFRLAFENGGVFLFDDIDRSSPQAFAAFNLALANGVCAFPDRVVKRHPDCTIIAAANTNGGGATSQYNAAQKIDAATLDRFQRVSFGYDEDLELTLAGSHRDWGLFVQAVRRSVAAQGLSLLVTPRATIAGAALLDAGMSLDEVKDCCLFNGCDASTVARIVAGL